MIWMFAKLFAVLCVGIAAYLEANSLEGWAWFLFVGLLGYGSVEEWSG